ncbi:MAG: hypothetical protein K9L68_10345 [Spirochaetales bacterium]|nr:hypothetical protein [Spirochaetales bacterium]MCF7938983.1 hypothetical protein [Spirochaetales bacterium]
MKEATMRVDNLREHTERAERLHLITLPVRALPPVIAVIFTLALALSTPAAFADDVSMDATAGDQVGTIYDESGKIAILGLANNNRVTMRIYAGLQVGGAGTWGRPGAQVTAGGMGRAESAGGRLRYTLYDNEGTYKITVETTENDYTDGSVQVEIININAGGSASGTLGTPASDFVPIKLNEPVSLITGIDGSNTWTGTYRSDGPWIRYALIDHPGGVSGSRLPVLYTLIPE